MVVPELWAREDHQSLGGNAQRSLWQGQSGLLLLPGSEIACTTPDEKRGTVGAPVPPLPCLGPCCPVLPLPQQLPQSAHVRELPPPASSALLLALLPPPLALWVPARSPAPWP